MYKKPSQQSDYEALSRNQADLEYAIRVRLIELIFSQDNATSIRAIEQLNLMSSDFVEDDYSGISTEALVKIRQRADEFIKANE